MSSSRTKGLSTRLTEEEYATLERAAGTQTLSVWARAVLLQAAAPARSDLPCTVGLDGEEPGNALVGSPADDRAAVRKHGPVHESVLRVARRAGSSWTPYPTPHVALTRPPAWLLVMLVFACFGAGGIAAYRYARVWTPLQRQYLSAYVWSAVPIIGDGSYELLAIVDQTEHRFALDADLVHLVPPTGGDTFVLAATAPRRGAARLAWQRNDWDHAALHAFLQHWIYQDQTLRDLTQPPLWAVLSVLVAALVPALSDQIAWTITRRTARSRWAP